MAGEQTEKNLAPAPDEKPGSQPARLTDDDRVSADEHLMKVAARHPSLAGRELIREILTRGPEPEATEQPKATDLRTAFSPRSLDHSDYRSLPEQADRLGKESQEMRDLFERGAVIKGETLIIPAEGHELPEERDQPFNCSLKLKISSPDGLGDNQTHCSLLRADLQIRGENLPSVHWRCHWKNPCACFSERRR
jgi:hypothetical protein